MRPTFCCSVGRRAATASSSASSNSTVAVSCPSSRSRSCSASSKLAVRTIREDGPNTSLARACSWLNTPASVTKYSGLRKVFTVAEAPARENLDALVGLQCPDSSNVVRVNPRPEHLLRRTLGQCFGGCAYKLIDISGPDSHHQSRVGTELSSTKGQRSDIGAGQLGTPCSRRRGKQHHGIDARHLGKDGNRLASRRSDARQSQAARARSSEANRLDAWISDQRCAQLMAACSADRKIHPAVARTS